MNDEVRFTAEGVLCEFLGSHDGRARLRVVLARTLRSGRSQRLDLTVQVRRSSVAYVVRALREFARRETAAADALMVNLGDGQP